MDPALGAARVGMVCARLDDPDSTASAACMATMVGPMSTYGQPWRVSDWREYSAATIMLHRCRRMSSTSSQGSRGWPRGGECHQRMEGGGGGPGHAEVEGAELLAVVLVIVVARGRRAEHAVGLKDDDEREEAARVRQREAHHEGEGRGRLAHGGQVA